MVTYWSAFLLDTANPIIYQLLPEILGGEMTNPVVLVISPLNIIQKDQIKCLKDKGINACRLNMMSKVEGATDWSEPDAHCDANLDKVKNGEYSIVLCHPEALFNTSKGQDLIASETFASSVIAVVVDECHIIEKWGAEFRTAFKKLSGIKSFFPDAPVIGLSGTLTVEQKKTIPKLLGLEKISVIEETPDRPNIFLEKHKKESAGDVLSEYEGIVFTLCDELFEKREKFPVTLLFIPIYYMSETMVYLSSLFGKTSIHDALYSAICSGQDEYVVNTTLDELKKEDPHIRLVLTTSIAGMGFDPKNVTQVIHACPPRNVSQYLQEVGRAGRRGQRSSAILYYSNRDISKNLPGINEDIIHYCRNEDVCLRNQLLSVFGFQKDENIPNCKCCSYCLNECLCESCVRL